MIDKNTISSDDAIDSQLRVVFLINILSFINYFVNYLAFIIFFKSCYHLHNKTFRYMLEAKILAF